MLFNQFLFTLAPSDVHTLSIKEAPTLHLEIQKPDPILPKHYETRSTSNFGGMSSGAEQEGSDMQLHNLSVKVTATSVHLASSAPTEVFNSFSVKLTASAAQPHKIKLPGSLKTAELEGLPPSKQYNRTLKGLVEGRPSLPRSSFVTTGGGSKYLLSAPSHCFWSEYITLASHIV